MELSPLVSGIVMPAIVMSAGADRCAFISREWQSELACANAQETSHAGANEDTDSSSATIDPANMRLIIMPISSYDK
jgi:hypothetical protein